MKSFKRLMGFTMVELIVVMAILAVLCGVIVPNVFAWLRDSKLKTCNSQAKVVFNTAVTVLQDYQLEGKVSQITTTDGVITIEKGDSNVATPTITAKLGSNFRENSVWYVNATTSNVNDKNLNTIWCYNKTITFNTNDNISLIFSKTFNVNLKFFLSSKLPT